MRIATDEIVISMDRSELSFLLDQMNVIANDWAERFAAAGDIDNEHPLAGLLASASIVDQFRMDLEKLRHG